jgi:acyl carrier protein
MAVDEDLQRQFSLMGITPLTAKDAMTGFDAVLRFGPAQIGIMDVDWVQWGKFEPTGGKSLRFAHLTGRRGGASTASLAESLRQLPQEERTEIVEIMLAEQLARTLRLPVERLDVKRPLAEMGIDSLMAVEIQIGINMVFGVEFSTLELARGLSVSQLAVPLLDRMGLATARATTVASGFAVTSPDSERPPRMEGRPVEYINATQTVGQ